MFVDFLFCICGTRLYVCGMNRDQLNDLYVATLAYKYDCKRRISVNLAGSSWILCGFTFSIGVREDFRFCTLFDPAELLRV